jgi:hypothetical protein
MSIVPASSREFLNPSLLQFSVADNDLISLMARTFRYRGRATTNRDLFTNIRALIL